MLSFFRHKLAFAKIDPLADGLGEEIAAERAESEHIDLKEQYDPDLGDRWAKIVKDVRKDPSWFDFHDE